jgi:predicted PurR-regulated permease PerM
VNAIFMAICGMKYAVLVSMIVGVTNLAPTFGPLVGAILGAFILLLVKPWYALAFLIFTVILQTFDGYILKPKLFGESFGVSGLWILIGIIVGGRMFGVVGILFAIPAVAILDFTYKNYFLYKIEELKEKRYGASAAPKEERNGTDADSEEDRNTNSEAVLRTEKERSEDRNLK